MQRTIIMDVKEEVYFARIIFQIENEILEKKIIELDARPSDCIALAVRTQSPIYIVSELWDSLPDVSSTLEEMRNQGDDKI
jgi:uncharacterized protein